LSPPNVTLGAAFYVWDLPVRLTHWLLVLLMLTSWITAENGWFEWHRFSGYALLTLVLFRLYWGFFGSTPARFAHFLRGPQAVLRALGGKSEGSPVGHTAAGGWSVAAMLFCLLLQAGLGLFAVHIDGLASGPLAKSISFETGRQAARLHAAVFNFLIALSSAHIAAILFYLLYKRENLTLPMLNGRQRVPQGAALPGYQFPAFWQALVGLALAVLLVLILTVGL
jgi:cytochrome b